MKSLLSSIAFVLAISLSGIVSTASSGEQLPNIVVLYADDLGFGDLSCQNPKSKIPTPNLDRLAEQGIRFTDGHSSSGICTPSRYALLTGRHHWRDFYGIVGALGGSVFQDKQLTMPEMFKAKGYRTAAIGKWHLGWDWDAIRKNPGKGNIQPEDFDWGKAIPDGPLAHGFDHYFGDTVINFPPYAWIEDDKVVKTPTEMMDTTKWKPIKEGRWECRPGPMVADWDPYQVLPTLAEKGEQYISSQAGAESPFFLYFAFPCPHAPIIPNDEFDGKSEAGPYGDFVVETDHVVGRLLKSLEQAGLSENTIVVFTADNGPEKYAYARDEKFNHWSAEPFRGLKRDIYEGGHHVPLIVRWPGVVKPGVSDALVSQIDLMATFASIINFSLPDDAAQDSHNLMPLLKGDVASVRHQHVHNTRANGYAIRSGEWLLIEGKSGYVSRPDPSWLKRHRYQPDDDRPVELYHLRSDIGQRNNVAEDHPDLVTELQKQLQSIRERGYSSPRLVKD